MGRRAAKRGMSVLAGTALWLISGLSRATLCGDGIVSPPEQCEPRATAFCDEACTSVGSAACSACGTGACAATLLPGCSPVGGPQGSSVCYDLLQCVYASHCMDTSTSLLSKCYCGSLSTVACGAAPLPNSGLPGAPDGACAGLIQQAYNLTSLAQPLALRLDDPTYPGSYANARLTCEKNNCATQCLGAAVVAVPAPTPASGFWSWAAIALSLLGIGGPLARRARRWA